MSATIGPALQAAAPTLLRVGLLSKDLALYAVGFVIASTVSYVVGAKTTRLAASGMDAVSSRLRTTVDTLDNKATDMKRAETLREKDAAAFKQKKSLADAVELEIARRIKDGVLVFGAKQTAPAE
jgi:hypothetical protein